MLKIKYHNQFKRDYKEFIEYEFNKNIDYLPYSQKCKSGGITGVKFIQEHELKGNYKECHITPDCF